MTFAIFVVMFLSPCSHLAYFLRELPSNNLLLLSSTYFFRFLMSLSHSSLQLSYHLFFYSYIACPYISKLWSSLVYLIFYSPYLITVKCTQPYIRYGSHTIQLWRKYFCTSTQIFFWVSLSIKHIFS